MILRLRRNGHALRLWGEERGHPVDDRDLRVAVAFLFPGWRAPTLDGRGVLQALQAATAGLASVRVAWGEDFRAALDAWPCVLRLVAAGRVAPLGGQPPGEARWRPTLLPAGHDPALVEALVDLWMRTAAGTAGSRAQAAKGRFLTADDAWLAALRAPNTACRPADPALDEALGHWAEPLFEGGREALPIRPRRDAEEWRLDLPMAAAGAEAAGPPPLGTLRLLGQAIAVAPLLALPQPWDDATFVRFLREAVPALRAAAFVVPLPPELDRHVPEIRETAIALVGDTLSVARTVRLGTVEIPEAEARAILDAGEALAFIQGAWRYVDLEALRLALDTLGPETIDRRRAIPLLLSGALRVGPGAQAVQDFLRGLSAPPEAPLPLAETLRPYQAQGVLWLMRAARNGLGVCLADDMGLGKTLQTIAFLLSRPGPALVVAPLTVLPVWEREFARWAPGLRILRHGGPDRVLHEGFVKLASAHDVVLTAYGYLWRDFPTLRRVPWQTLVLDEAQLIKNPTTRQSQAARALNARARLALTGTPIENRLDDLWSILDFLNPGLFGPRRDFAERYADPARLRRAASHFLLRRLKTDPAILPDLPPRITQDHYAPLTPAQAAAYDLALAHFAHTAPADGRDAPRRGAVLALLTRLKLICDGSGDGLDDAPSGKLLTLLPLLETILAGGESALLFTQYARVGQALQTTLAERLGRPVPFLHGALTPAQRAAEVAAFSNPPRPGLLILSLRAGAFGLTLTKANHVIHYDRWWNPAVENQATDRAHRIGQTKTVIAHRLICRGTLEERIDRLLRDKQLLADRIVAPTPAALLARLPTPQLLATLARDTTPTT